MSYKDLINEVYSIKEISVAMKDSPVINTKLKMIGLYTKDIAKLIKKYQEINLNEFELDEIYEINYIYIAIGLLQNKTIERQYEFLKQNIYHIDSWAITDSNYKYLEFKEFNEELVFIKKFISSKDEFMIRLGYLILFKYLKEENLDIIFSLLKNSDLYYVYMIEAWLIQTIFVKYPRKTYIFLENSDLSKKIKLKTISKICDSYRVDKEYKDKVKKLRENLKKLEKNNANLCI